MDSTTEECSGIPYVKMVGGWDGLDTAYDRRPAPQGGRDDQPPEDDEAADRRKNRKGEASGKKKPRDVIPLLIEKTTGDKKLMLEITGDSKTVVDWVNGHAKLKSPESIVATAQNLLWKWWSRGVALRRRVADRAVDIFRYLKKKLMFGLGEASKVTNWNGLLLRMWSGPKSPPCARFGMAAVSEAFVVQGC